MLRPLILRSMAGRPAAARRGRCSWSRCATNPQFGAVFFRRSTMQVRNEGGLWDESEKLYPAIGAAPKEHVLQWNFPSGASVSFAHLEHDKTVLNWQGSPMPLICFDELTHFSAKEFWYMVSRNRSMSGVRPYIRATCNPDADSWVAAFISWWINQDTGLPIRNVPAY
ncbi:terminase large subunit domain-containing protein [Rhizobium giardinii]|uniref:terminase large subunit domain-containing protein n=1 Tax=Rhizobium giardinii TaxID=56731 RepID=UPI0039E0BC8C